MVRTLVIREESGDVVELETFAAIDRVKHARAILLTSEDAHRYRTGALTPPRVSVASRLSAMLEGEPVPTKRPYKRRDKRAEG